MLGKEAFRRLSHLAWLLRKLILLSISNRNNCFLHKTFPPTSSQQCVDLSKINYWTDHQSLPMNMRKQINHEIMKL